jgi:DNA-binding NarL/FixJ family response regulator
MTAARIRILVIDDHALFREGLARLLEGEPDIEVTGCVGSGAEAAASLAEVCPDLVILDVDLGAERGLNLLPMLRRLCPDARILVVTAGLTDREAVQYVEGGAAGIFHKTRPPYTLCEAVRKVFHGEVYLEPGYVKPLFSAVQQASTDDRPRLTEREIAITRMILEGLANKEIAARLSVAESTVKAALRVLFEKVGVRTRSQLVKVALEQYREYL